MGSYNPGFLVGEEAGPLLSVTLSPSREGRLLPVHAHCYRVQARINLEGATGNSLGGFNVSREDKHNGTR